LGESGPESFPYEFPGGYPSSETVQRAYDDADLNRAVQAYRFFFASVSGLAIFKGNEVLGLRANSVFGTLATEPKHVGLTLNSDTPYAPLPLDLRDGPMVIELPPGPLICVAMDVNQRWVADMGLPGPPIRAGVDGMSSCRRATRGTSPRATTPAGRPATGYSAGSGRCRLGATSRRPPSC